MIRTVRSIVRIIRTTWGSVMKGGRPAVYLGGRVQDKRIRYINLKGRTRAFYARWRPQLKRWECHLTGYGLKHRQWFSESQTLALHTLRMTPCLWDWRKVVIDKAVLWDGVPDNGYGVGQEELFSRHLDDPQSEAANTVLATSSDQLVFPRGAGDASPAVTQEPELIDHDGLEVGTLPADQIERYFPAHAFKGPRGQAVAA